MEECCPRRGTKEHEEEKEAVHEFARMGTNNVGKEGCWLLVNGAESLNSIFKN
jgi:hypothetical protein